MTFIEALEEAGKGKTVKLGDVILRRRPGTYQLEKLDHNNRWDLFGRVPSVEEATSKEWTVVTEELKNG